ncbi:MAG: hypothetical protein K1X57_10105, partial [Gemmataceae bacterium]|nr:hypothetical protein [Gemmataceae bacterium]
MPALLAVSPVAYGTLALAAGLFLVALFWAVRPGGVSLLALLTPRERALRTARRKLLDGDWQGAFNITGQLRNPAKPDPAFERRLLSFEGDCLYRGAERSLQLGRYAEALELMRGAGDRLGLPEVEFDKRIVGLLLAEIRRRITSDPAGHEVARLCNEAIRVAGNLPEASFWLALHHLHKNEEPQAREALHDALADPQVPDPALYLGVICRRAGQPAEALRWLGRAMGNAPDCLVVQWQFAAAALDAGSDPTGAVKTLEKVTAADGLPKYEKTSNLIWSDLGPRSWLAALVRRTPVPCPIGLDRVRESLAEARRILAAGLDKCERSADAAAMYYQSFSAGDESLAVRKGLGLNLARAGLYDDALPHLAAAHALESPPTPLTTGYLALATARARAANPIDRANHVREAFGLLTAVQVRDDPEWSKLARELAGEAKDAGVELPTAQKLELAKAFASIEARDPVAIDAYNQLAATDVEIPLEVAFVYIRAATEQDIRGQHDLALFDRAFKDRDAFRKSFQRKKWDADAVERAYLERSVEARPGRYPDAPGPLYAALAERHLLEEHRRLTSQGITARAEAALQLAATLGPTRALTLDRLAERADLAGDRAECLRI